MFCPKAGPSLQAEKPRLQFCRRQIFHRKLRKRGCSFTRDLIGAVASRCFPHPTVSLASQQTLKDLKRGAPTWRSGECIWLTEHSGLHRNSPQGLNISSIRVFDQVRDPEIPITLRPHIYIYISEMNRKLPYLFIPRKLQPWFLTLGWKTCLWAELQP